MAEQTWHGATFTDLDLLIRKIARNETRRFSCDWRDVGDEFVQIGWEEVLRAAEKYEDRGYKFTTYAYKRIWGKIFKAAKARVGLDTKYEFVDIDAIEIAYDADLETQLMLLEALSAEDVDLLIARELGIDSGTTRQRQQAKQRLAEAYAEIR